VDADAILEKDSLVRIVKPVIDDPDVLVAAAGIVRLANGATIVSGRMLEFHLPRNRLAVMQIVEYFRAFLVGRIGWDSLGAVLIVSGAFGLFRRSAVEAVGGYTHGRRGHRAGSCGCTSTSASAGTATGSRSSPSRPAGPRRRRISRRFRRSADAGSAGWARRCGAIGA
jgi:cellulose synthase/poly-beta-1,6-N-acetylglucosamine synthase-like glycosyltransferase